jgi:2,4-dienoyl-CoA reductase-like NADH-dependent reductase (Old Yellow Enzyme family)/thioredoxin reductase
MSRLGDDQLSIDDDKFLPGIQEIAKLIHSYDVKVALQLQHGGNVVKSNVTHLKPVAPSAIPRPGYEIPKELSIREIKIIIERFAEAAKRGKSAGYDAIEISACHRYLIQNFLSPAWNKREDEYGGSLANRCRFLLEIIRAIKERCGQDFPLIVRMNGMEYDVPNGTTLEEAMKTARIIQNAGISAINVSAFPANYPYPLTAVSATLPLFHQGCFLNLATGIKKAVQIPVIAVGRMTPEIGERAIKDKKADIIAFGRGLIVDPQLPKKVLDGKIDEIRRCIGCLECYDPDDFARRCSVNPTAFSEKQESSIRATSFPKKVLVIGGGPGGMEAARVAALRGHQVTIYDKDPKLGGQLLLGAIFRKEYQELNDYLRIQLTKLGVEIQLNKKFDLKHLNSINADAIVVAIGPSYYSKEIPGINESIVFSKSNMSKKWYGRFIGAKFISQRWFPSIVDKLIETGFIFGKKIVIMGGGLASLELGDFLINRGREIVIVTEKETAEEGLGTMPILRQHYLDKLNEKGIRILSGVHYEKITKEGLNLKTREGKNRSIEANCIVFIPDARPNLSIYSMLKDKVREVQNIGDSAHPAGILEAIRDGYKIGNEI